MNTRIEHTTGEFEEDKPMSDFWQGVKAASPLIPGFLPFALIVGAGAIEVGLPLPMALSMSVIMFAGAAQLTFLALLEQNAPLTIIILTALIINLRFTIYSALISPYFKSMSLARKSLFSYLLSDQACLLSMPTIEQPGQLLRGRRFYLGSALSLWLVWQLGCFTGVLLGQTLPPTWQLDFAVPLSFLALLVPMVKTKPTLAAALVAGISMLWTHQLPLHMGLISATLLGALAGVFCEGRQT